MAFSKLNSKHVSQSGFTVVELLVVVAIIGLLASISLVSAQKVEQRASDAQAALDFRAMQQAIELYYQDQKNYPILSASSSPQSIANWNQLGTQLRPYISKLPLPEGYPNNPWIYTYIRGTPTNHRRIQWYDDNTNELKWCIYLYDAYWLNFELWDHDTPLALSDGGINPDSIESFGGNYKIENNPANCTTNIY